MRRKDREKNKEFAYGVIDKAPFATLSMIRPDKSAYGIAVSVVREDDHLYFHSAMEGEKIDSIMENSQVCISAVGDCKPIPEKFTMEYESAVAFGNAHIVSDEDEKTHALFLICKRFAEENLDSFQEAITQSLKRTAVIRVDITHVTGKRNI